LATGAYPLDGVTGGTEVVVAGGAVVVVAGGAVVVVAGAAEVVVEGGAVVEVVAEGGGTVVNPGARSGAETSVTGVSAAASWSETAPSPVSFPQPPSTPTRATTAAAVPAKVRAIAFDLTYLIMPRPPALSQTVEQTHRQLFACVGLEQLFEVAELATHHFLKVTREQRCDQAERTGEGQCPNSERTRGLASRSVVGSRPSPLPRERRRGYGGGWDQRGGGSWVFIAVRVWRC
jgi:hypothetical protein